MSDASNTVVFYEGSNFKLDFRHHGRAAVAVATGEARFVTPEEAKKLIWQLKP